MANLNPKTREKAFRLRLERKSFADVSKEVNVSPKTLARWEKGWVDAQGRKHTGWKPELERLWREKADSELQFGLLIKEERLKTYEELARLAVAKIKESFPTLKAKTAADAKALLSEIRELCRLIARERGELNPDPRAVVAIKADISIDQLRERYKAVEVVEVKGAPCEPAKEKAEEGPGEAAEEEEGVEADETDETADES